eukprot:UN12688
MQDTQGTSAAAGSSMQDTKEKFDIFISHATADDSHDVFVVVSTFMQAKGLRVFNPTTDL